MKEEIRRKRKTGKEQFYTPSWVAQLCTKSMLQVVGDLAYKRTWLEPAGGTGVFVECVKSHGVQDVVSYDIESHHSQVQKTEDFLKENISHLKGCLVITNPPFGRMHQLSVPFFNKCAEVADYIGFLVPKSWKKWTITNRLSLDFHNVLEEEFKVNFHDADGNELDGGGINVVFQVWERRPKKREKVKVPDRGYITKCSREKSDVGIAIFGFGSGKLRTPDVDRKCTYYFKCNKPWVMQALKEVNFDQFALNNVSIPSLSMMEINYLLNEWADKNGHT